MRIRIHRPVNKSSTPINTTLVAKQQKQQPANHPKLDAPNPKFNFDLSKIPISSPHRSSQLPPTINPKLVDNKSSDRQERETESKNSETAVQTFASSPSEQPQEADESKKQLQQPESRVKSKPQRPRADILAKIKTLSRYNFDLTKIPISAPNRPPNLPPVQSKLNFDLSAPNRLQQPINRRREETQTEELRTKAIAALSIPRIQLRASKEAKYGPEDWKKVQEGIKSERRGTVMLPSSKDRKKKIAAGVLYSFSNFFPGRSIFKGKLNQDVMNLMVREMLAFYQPLTGFKYPKPGKPVLPVSQNLYVSASLPVVVITGCTDNVGGYGPEKTDRSLRSKRALTIKNILEKLLLRHIQVPMAMPEFQIEEASPGIYIEGKGGKDAESRALNRVVLVHIRPKIVPLTEQQQKQVFEEELKRKSEKIWTTKERKKSLEKIKKLQGLPGLEKGSEMEKKAIENIQNWGRWIINNFDVLYRNVIISAEKVELLKKPDGDIELIKQVSAKLWNEYLYINKGSAQPTRLVPNMFPDERRGKVTAAKQTIPRLKEYRKKYLDPTEGPFFMKDVVNKRISDLEKIIKLYGS